MLQTFAQIRFIMATEIVGLLSVRVLSVLFESIGKFNALHSIATHQAFPEAFLSEAWEEFGRLQVLGNNLVQSVRGNFQDLPSGNVLETLQLSLRDLNTFLDYGIRSFCTTPDSGVVVDQEDVSDEADRPHASPEEVLQDISDVIADLYKLDMLIATYREEIEDMDGSSIISPSNAQDQYVENSIMASPKSIGSTININRSNPVPIAVSPEPTSFLPVPVSTDQGGESQIADMSVRTPARLLQTPMISKSTQTSTRPSQRSTLLENAKPTPWEPWASTKTLGKSVQTSEEHPTFSNVPDRRTNKQRHFAAARLISWVYDHESLSPDTASRTSNTNGLAGYEAIKVAEGTQDIEYLRPIFRSLDQEGNKHLTEGRLHAVLTNPDNTLFDPHTAKLLMRIFDIDNTGSLDFRQFHALWGFLAAWRSIFNRFDEGNKGSLTYDDYQLAVKGFFRNTSPSCLPEYYQAYERRGDGTMKFDMFIHSSIDLKRKLDWFRAYDNEGNGIVTRSLDQYLSGKSSRLELCPPARFVEQYAKGESHVPSLVLWCLAGESMRNPALPCTPHISSPYPLPTSFYHSVSSTIMYID